MDELAILNPVVPRDKVVFNPEGKAKVGDGRRPYNSLPFTIGAPGPQGPPGETVFITGPKGDKGDTGSGGPSGPPGSVGNITLTGDVTASGPSPLTTTLATVNSNTGAFGSATKVAVPTVNDKGLVTAMVETTVTPAFSSITGTPTTLSGYGITDAQPLDSDLTAIAGLTATTDSFMQSKSSAWAARTIAQVKTDLGLTGTNSGDQTITLTGGVTGAGTGSFAATVVTNANLTGDVTSVGNATTLASIPAIAGTNLTGTAANLTAGHVTTNANLTGDVTSSGNATTLGNIPAIAGTNLTGTAANLTAGNATKWTTGRTIALTGDVTYTSGSLDGSGNVTGTATLASIPAIAGTNLTGTAANLTSGNATKWTTGRTIALTGDVTYTSGSLDGSGNVTGTATLANIPAIAGTNLTGTAASLTAGNATKWTTGRTVALTGDVTYTSGSLDGSGNVTGTAAVANVPAAATHEQAINTIPTNTGGWTEYFVTGSAVNISTTSGTGDVVTGLTTAALSNSTKYEFEVILHVVNAADANGVKLTINGGGSGSTLIAHMFATTTAAAATAQTLNTIDTLSSAFTTATSIPGVVQVHGFFVTGGTAAVVNVKCAKVTGNTATVQVGSTFRVRKAHT